MIYVLHIVTCFGTLDAVLGNTRRCFVLQSENIPVTHMPEKLYMSKATMSIRRTMAIGLEWKIICMTTAQLSVTLCIAT